MTDFATHHAKTREDSAAAPPPGSLFALAMLVVLIVGAAAFVALVLWPRWPGAAVAPDAPALPITVGGVLFNVPPAAIRVPMQRHSGAQERLDLAFLWPSLAPPDPAAKPAPTESRAADRPAVHHHRAAVGRARAERPRAHDLSALSRRHAVRRAGRAEGDLVQGRHALSGRGPVLRSGRAAGLRGALLAARARPARPACACYERRIEGADVTVRFPSDWLTGWRAVNDGHREADGEAEAGRLSSSSLQPLRGRSADAGRGRDLAGAPEQPCGFGWLAAICAGRFVGALHDRRAADAIGAPRARDRPAPPCSRSTAPATSADRSEHDRAGQRAERRARRRVLAHACRRRKRRARSASAAMMIFMPRPPRSWRDSIIDAKCGGSGERMAAAGRFTASTRSCSKIAISSAKPAFVGEHHADELVARRAGRR